MKKDLYIIGVIGHVEIGKSAFIAAEALSMQEKVAIIGVGDDKYEGKIEYMTTQEIMDKYQVPIETFDVEISGVKYRRIKKEKPSPKYMDLSEILQSDVYTPYLNELSSLSSNRNKLPMPKINIETEFILIQCKKSKLTKREREWVVSQFNKLYQIV